MSCHWARAYGTWLGITFGCVLFVFAFASAGMGHGTYIPFAIFGAPISIVPVLGWFILPVWWGAVGRMLAVRRKHAALAMMALHTVSVGLYLQFGLSIDSDNDQLIYFAKVERMMPGWLWGGITIYVGGLTVAWLAAITKTDSDRLCPTSGDLPKNAAP